MIKRFLKKKLKDELNHLSAELTREVVKSEKALRGQVNMLEDSLEAERKERLALEERIHAMIEQAKPKTGAPRKKKAGFSEPAGATETPADADT